MADRLVTSGANIHSVLVVHRGNMVFEHYFKGRDEVPSSFLGTRFADLSFDPGSAPWAGAASRSASSPELDLVVVATAGCCQDHSPQAFDVQYSVFADVLKATSLPA